MYCEKENLYVKRTLFMEILADEKISIYKPKKDQCDTCLGYKHGSVSKEIYDEHQMKKEEGRRAKENDKVTAKHVYTMDVEALGYWVV